MALKVPDASLPSADDYLVGSTPHPGFNGNVDLHLYQNNHTPASTDTVANYTECDFTSYSLSTVSDFASATLVSGRGSSTTETYTWTLGSPPPPIVSNANVYGYYVTNHGGTNLLFAEKFSDGPYPMVNPGSTISVTLTFTVKSEF